MTPLSDPAQPATVAPDTLWTALVALKARWQAESDPGRRAEIRDEYYRLHQDYIVARRKARYPDLTGYRPIPTADKAADTPRTASVAAADARSLDAAQATGTAQDAP